MCLAIKELRYTYQNKTKTKQITLALIATEMNKTGVSTVLNIRVSSTVNVGKRGSLWQ